jgi:hypothetical protein
VSALGVQDNANNTTVHIGDSGFGGGGNIQIGTFGNAKVQLAQTNGIQLGNDLAFAFSKDAGTGGSNDIVATRAASGVLKLADVFNSAGVAIQLPQRATNPANPASSAEVNVYVKGNKIVFQYNDAGTVRYVTYDLTQSATALWATSTSAP